MLTNPPPPPPKKKKKTFKHLDSDTLLCLYKSMARPHLEYCSTVWTVLLKKEASEIEKIQRRATKMVKNIKDLSVLGKITRKDYVN